MFILTSWNEIKLIYNKCLDVNNSSSIKAKITLYGCNKGSESQFWHYDHVSFLFNDLIVDLFLIPYLNILYIILEKKDVNPREK